MRLTTWAFVLTVAAGCGGPEPREGAPEGAAPAPEVQAPADPATVRSIAPASGAPGTEVTVRAGGLPPGARFEVGFGAANTNFEILGQAAADSLGELSVVVKVPEWAEAGRGYQFVVAPVNQPPRAASDTFRVTAPTP
jgi:hypothetical protein